MGLKVATTSLHWSQPSVPHSPSSSQTLASAIPSPSSKRRCFVDGALFCRYAEKSFLSSNSKLARSRSCDNSRSRVRNLRRAFTASLASFSDDEFSKQIQELALRFQLSSDEDSETSKTTHDHVEIRGEDASDFSTGEVKFLGNLKPFDPLKPPDFPERDEIIPANIEMKANSVDIPLSLRMIKRKKQWQDGFIEASESAYCSMKKAFSSMVFIIRELHTYTLHMREVLYYEDLQGILARVQREMHASFVWLFQQVFSHTPTLMVHVMILLANYSVYSMANSTAIAATPPLQPYAAATEEVSMVEEQSQSKQKFDSSSIRTFNLSSSNGKMASIGGSNGGGGKYRPVANGTDGEGRFDESNYNQTIIPNDVSSIGNPSRTRADDLDSRLEQETSLWNSMVDEASKMQDVSRDEALDHETMQSFVSPIDAKVETDENGEYFKTELQYQTVLAQEPNNPLLLANYGQFLYLVVQDFDRAEDFFKRAAAVEPKDAEALNKYANFLWMVRNDICAAEETYLEAISAEPENSYYAANYAHFLWNTGGEDTCFPLSPPDSNWDA